VKMDLNNWSIGRKILGLVVLLSVVTAMAAGIGVFSVDRLGRSTEQMDISTSEIRLGGQFITRVVALNRAEYALAADPASLSELAPEIARIRQEARGILTEARSTAGEDRKALLAQVGNALETYVAALEETMAVAKQAGNVEVGEEQARVLASVEDSRSNASMLRDKAREYVEFIEGRSGEVSQTASTTASLAFLVMIGVALAGVLGGLAIGHFVSRRTIVRPLDDAIGTLRNLADGNLEVEIVGADRGDEIGDIARAMVTFKDGALAQRRMVSEQEEEAKRKAERAELIQKTTSKFETEVEEILNILSSSSSELEATA